MDKRPSCWLQTTRSDFKAITKTQVNKIHFSGKHKNPKKKL